MKNLKIISVENPEEAAEKVLEMIKEQQENGKLDVLGLATGSAMIPIYKELADSDLSFESITTFNLDGYAGFDRSNKNS